MENVWKIHSKNVKLTSYYVCGKNNYKANNAQISV